MRALFFITVVMIACSSAPKRDPQSEVFAYYLRSAFGDSIPDAKHTWVLVPQNGCKGCRQSELALLHEELRMTGVQELEYVFSPDVPVPVTLVRPAGYRIDDKGLIDKINLPVSNITIIQTENGRILQLHEVTADRMDSLREYLK